MTHDMVVVVGGWFTQTPLYPHPTCFSCSTASMPPCMAAACRFSLLSSLVHLPHLLLGTLRPAPPHLILFSTYALQTPTLNCDR